MTGNAEVMQPAAVVIQGIAHDLAIESDGFIGVGIDGVSGLRGAVR